MRFHRHSVLFALLLAGIPLQAQRVGVQVKAGAVVSAKSSDISIGRFFGQAFEANRLIIGPAVEFRITPKVAFEFDVLFQSADLRGAGASAAIFPRSSWQADTSIRYFPVLAKYRLRKQNFTPFAVAGGALPTLQPFG